MILTTKKAAHIAKFAEFVWFVWLCSNVQTVCSEDAQKTLIRRTEDAQKTLKGRS